MTILQLRDRLIADGIAEVIAEYPEDDPRRVGAVEGFELCRSFTNRQQFEKVKHRRECRDTRRALDVSPTQEQKDAYWRSRYATLQIEWVLNCLLAAGWARAGEPISGRAMMKVAEVTGQVI